MEQLFGLLNGMQPMSENLTEYLQKALLPKDVRKNDYLLRAGHINSDIFYVESGLFMAYYELKERWVVSWFMGAGEVIASPSSFFPQEKSHENIIALTPGKVYYVTHQTLEQVYGDFPEFNVHGRLLAQKYYQLSEERNYMIKTRTTIERYAYLEAHHPEWILQIPNKHVASFLGTTESTLSKIRSKRTALR
jgi:CRP/FNR family transcriptional regulator, anaerobic regulatory protein